LDLANAMAKTRKRPEGEPASSETRDTVQIVGAPHSSAQPPERIAARAYELYLARGASDGMDFDDWLTAERELSSGPSQGSEKA
jgi:hypothetical protein